MLILAIDTALDACAAAVLDTEAGKLIAQESQAMKRGHAEALMPLIARVIAQSAIAFAGLDRIVVTTGPGSFTGLRVGLSAARGIAQMDREMRAGNWLREDGMQLKGKTLGLIGFGGIAAEVARIASGSGLRVIAWNRTPTHHAGVEFIALDALLAESHVVSLHLLLNDETRGFVSRQRIAAMKPGVILVNTARGALVDEAAMIEALRSGHIRHAGLAVFNIEPLPPDHPLTRLRNVTLSAHSAFRTPEASENLIEAAWQHCRRIARG